MSPANTRPHTCANSPQHRRAGAQRRQPPGRRGEGARRTLWLQSCISVLINPNLYLELKGLFQVYRALFNVQSKPEVLNSGHRLRPPCAPLGRGVLLGKKVAHHRLLILLAEHGMKDSGRERPGRVCGRRHPGRGKRSVRHNRRKLRKAQL